MNRIMRATAQEIVELTGGVLENAPQDRLITGFASLAEAGATDVSFLGNLRYAAQLRVTGAGLVFLSDVSEVTPESAGRVIVPNASVAFARVVERYGFRRPRPEAGAHPSAVIDPSARVDLSLVSVGAHAVIGREVVIGAGTEIAAGVVVGDYVRMGEDCRLCANVSVRERCEIGRRVVIQDGSVIGSDGFGYELVDGRQRKVEQLGIVVIEDDVEIGASVTVDRARFGRTVIGEGSKLDNLVQVAHNVQIGKHCLFAAQVGIAGSTRIGDYVTMGGQSGVAGHLEVAEGTVLGGRAGLTKSVTVPGQQWMGFPAQEMREWREVLVRGRLAARKIVELRGLEERLKRLVERLGD